MKNFALQLLESYASLYEQDQKGFVQVFSAARSAQNGTSQVLSPPTGGSEAQVGKSEDGNAYIKGGPFGSGTRSLLELSPEDKEKINNWWAGALEPEQEVGAGQTEPEADAGETEAVVDPFEGLPVKEKKRMIQQTEAIEELNSISPGMGDSVLRQYEAQKRLIEADFESRNMNDLDKRKYKKQALERLHGDYFSGKNSSLKNKIISAHRRELLYLERKSGQKEETEVTLFEREPITSTQASQAVGKIEEITKTIEKLKRGTLDAEGKRSLLQELRRNREVLQRNEDGTVFLRVDESTEAGLSFNTSPQHALSQMFDEYDELVSAFEEDNSDLLDEGESLSIQQFQVDTDGGNMGEIVKNVSEELEAATHYFVTGNTQEGLAIVKDIAIKYKDSIRRALKLQEGMSDEHTEKLRVMLKDMGIDKDSDGAEIATIMTDIIAGHISRRREFYQRYKPEFVTRVGEGSVGKGNKADNLLIWTSPPTEKTARRLAQKVKFQDLDKKTQQQILKDGGDPNKEYYVVGLSLKTYQGGIRTKTGESYNLVGVSDRYNPSQPVTGHEAFVLGEMRKAGLSEAQIGLARAEIESISKHSSFCKSIVANADELQIVGQTPQQAQKAVIKHLEGMMKQHGIKYPLNDINYFDKLEGKDGVVDEKSRKDFLKTFSSYLEKELILKHLRARTKNGKLQDPTLHALLIMGADAGLDSVRPVLGGTTKLSTNSSHTYVQNEEIIRATQEIINGTRPYEITNQGLQAGGNFSVQLERRSHGIQINGFLSSKSEDLNEV